MGNTNKKHHVALNRVLFESLQHIASITTTTVEPNLGRDCSLSLIHDRPIEAGILEVHGDQRTSRLLEPSTKRRTSKSIFVNRVAKCPPTIDRRHNTHNTLYQLISCCDVDITYTTTTASTDRDQRQQTVTVCCISAADNAPLIGCLYMCRSFKAIVGRTCNSSRIDCINVGALQDAEAVSRSVHVCVLTHRPGINCTLHGTAQSPVQKPRERRCNGY